tara:strand:- start:157485 stop:159083 length:1599 start_codon:yes stop_codon:yes gene_type:complete
MKLDKEDLLSTVSIIVSILILIFIMPRGIDFTDESYNLLFTDSSFSNEKGFILYGDLLIKLGLGDNGALFYRILRGGQYILVIIVAVFYVKKLLPDKKMLWMSGVLMPSVIMAYFLLSPGISYNSWTAVNLSVSCLLALLINEVASNKWKKILVILSVFFALLATMGKVSAIIYLPVLLLFFMKLSKKLMYWAIVSLIAIVFLFDFLGISILGAIENLMDYTRSETGVDNSHTVTDQVGNFVTFIACLLFFALSGFGVRRLYEIMFLRKDKVFSKSNILLLLGYCILVYSLHKFAYYSPKNILNSGISTCLFLIFLSGINNFFQSKNWMLLLIPLSIISGVFGTNTYWIVNYSFYAPLLMVFIISHIKTKQWQITLISLVSSLGIFYVISYTPYRSENYLRQTHEYLGNTKFNGLYVEPSGSIMEKISIIEDFEYQCDSIIGVNRVAGYLYGIPAGKKIMHWTNPSSVHSIPNYENYFGCNTGILYSEKIFSFENDSPLWTDSLYKNFKCINSIEIDSLQNTNLLFIHPTVK